VRPYGSVRGASGNGRPYRDEKSETVDPVTGQKTKVKRKVKAESDGDYKLDEKVKSTGPEGKSKSKTKIRAEGDGDYKEKTKVSGPDGKYESKTKVDK
jgi:hypothetical protein